MTEAEFRARYENVWRRDRDSLARERLFYEAWSDGATYQQMSEWAELNKNSVGVAVRRQRERLETARRRNATSPPDPRDKVIIAAVLYLQFKWQRGKLGWA